MSGEEAAERTATEDSSAAHLGVLATWRQTSTQTRALLAGVFVSRLAGFLQIFLVLFLTNRGFSFGQAGLALTIYGGGAVLGSFIGGWLSDRLSPRSATLISMVGSAALIISILYLQVYLLILLAVALASTVGQLYRPAAQAMITELTPPGQLVMVTAMYRLCLNLGTTVTPLIGALLLSVSYNLLFWAEALAALAYGLIALKLLPGRSASAEASAGEAEQSRRSGYRAVLSDWRYMFFLASVLFISLVYVQYLAALPLAIKDANLSVWWYAAVVSLNAVIVATCEVPATKYVQTWPLRLTALAGWGMVAIGYGMYAIAIAPIFLILGTLFWTSSEIMGAPTTFAYPGMIAPAHLRGRYVGAMLTTFTMGNAVGPIIGVTLWEHLRQQMWLWAAALAVLATICARIGMRQPEPQAATEAPEPASGPVGAPAPEPASGA